MLVFYSSYTTGELKELESLITGVLWSPMGHATILLAANINRKSETQGKGGYMSNTRLTNRSHYIWLVVQWLLRCLLWNDDLQIWRKFLFCLQLLQWLFSGFFRRTEVKPAFSVFWDFFFIHICGPKSGSVLLIFLTCRIFFFFLFGKYAFSYAGHVRPRVPPNSQQKWHSYFCWHFSFKLINIFIGAIINILWAGFPHPLNLLWLHFILEHVSGQHYRMLMFNLGLRAKWTS